MTTTTAFLWIGLLSETRRNKPHSNAKKVFL